MQAILDLAAEELHANNPPDTEVTDILHALKASIDSSYKKPFQYYPRIRTFFARDFGKDSRVYTLAERTFRMTPTQMAQATAKARARVRERNVKQTVIHSQFVEDAVDWLRANGATVDKIVLLMLASGSRRCEIMDTGRASFSADGVPSGSILQQGFAKKGSQSIVESVVKPLLFLSSGEFLDILQDVHDATADLEPDSRGLLSQFDDRLELLSKECFPQFVSNGFPVGTHVCRAIYVNMAYHLHHQPRESLVAFAARVLGHEGLASVPNYLHVAIAFDRDSEDGKEASRQESEIRQKVTIVELNNEDGQSFRLRPVPHRRLGAQQRKELKQNHLANLEAKRIPTSLALLKLLKLA